MPRLLFGKKTRGTKFELLTKSLNLNNIGLSPDIILILGLREVMNEGLDLVPAMEKGLGFLGENGPQ